MGRWTQTLPQRVRHSVAAGVGLFFGGQGLLNIKLLLRSRGGARGWGAAEHQALGAEPRSWRMDTATAAAVALLSCHCKHELTPGPTHVPQRASMLYFLSVSAKRLLTEAVVYARPC